MTVRRAVAVVRLASFLVPAVLLAACAVAPGAHRAGPASTTTQDDAVRLLEQASFGPTPETVGAVRHVGAAAYVDAQLRLPASRLPALPPVVGQAKDVCGDDTAPAASTASGTTAPAPSAVSGTTAPAPSAVSGTTATAPSTASGTTATAASTASGTTTAAAPSTANSTTALAPSAPSGTTVRAVSTANVTSAPAPTAALSTTAMDFAKQCRRDAYSEFQLQRAFFRNALAAPDQLRQRTAFALGQIFVVSGRKNNRAYAMARYQQLLLDDAFGTFRQLLTDVTLSPMMGDYLDMANNRASPGASGKNPAAPNENYAREVLQLFSVGLVRLHADGTPVLGADGRPLPTYGADEVRDFARVFTGWTYPTAPGATPKPRNPAYFDGQLQPVPAAHDARSKTLLDGVTIPAQPDPRRDLDAALDNIARHPNVGPFIGRRLIQALVTSNPSPQYVARISAVFADDGHGVRGNLGAVVRAILLDPAARGDAKPDPGYGKAREPVLWLTGVLRALGGTGSDGVALIGQSAGMGENVYAAPSVFNFYSPDHAMTTDAGATLYAPEMAIVDSDTSLKRAAFADRLLFGAPIKPDPTLEGATGTRVVLTALEPLATDPDRLVDALDAQLLHHRLPTAARQQIVAAVRSVPATDASKRARTAAFLVVAGPQYQVQQ